MQVADTRAVVTGAAGGLGGHFACELVRAGAQVMAGDTNAAGLRRLAAHAAELPGKLFVARLDVTDEASVTGFVAEAVERLGRVNALLNCAGIVRDGLLVGREGETLQKLPLAQWRKVIDVNLTGQFLITREVAAQMIAAGEASDASNAESREGEGGGAQRTDAVIVNFSSLVRAGNPGQANYAASKAGLDACTRTWALELARHGIRVGGVAPGVTDTTFLEGIAPEARTRLREAIPLGRLGRPEDLWLAVKFILECEFFTGRTVEVDGGAAMGYLGSP